MKINVASWNIWIAGKRDAKGIADLVRENKIDILGAQEVGIFHDITPSLDFGKEIAKELGFNYTYFVATDVRETRKYKIGNAIFSRFPIISSEAVQLNPPDIVYDETGVTEPRILVVAKIDLGDGKIINFLTTHLQYLPKFETHNLRLNQIAIILEEVKKLKQNLVLVGDFNTIPGSEEIKKLEESLVRLGSNEPTWTVHPFDHHDWQVNELLYAIDHIFASKDLKAGEFKIIDSKLSDHLPVMATIEV